RGYTSRIGRNDHTNLGFSSLRQERQTRSLRSEAARGSAGSGAPLTGGGLSHRNPEVRGRQRQRREWRTTDRGWTEPQEPPAGNVTRYAALGSRQLT
ncbi:hypothetical protein THAOC_26974, partial [Thalassiosira oceanica]